MTFSVVAHDPASASWGVAVQSKFLAVGALVPWARAGAGAVATQAWCNTRYGPRGLELLGRGRSAREVVEELVAADPGRDQRQLAVVDARGEAWAWTGAACPDWAGHRTGPGFSCQGNILAGPRVVEAMAEAFAAARGELAERLLAALRAGQEAGGDRRGQESAALLVVREGGGYGGFDDRLVDLRVDDHPRPVEELGRLLELHRLYFGESREVLPLEGETARRLLAVLAAAGFHLDPGRGWDEAAERALRELYGIENFEERDPGPGKVDAEVLDFLARKYAPAEPTARGGAG
ncbi:MAG: DUF1028 domain-containing protein [Firmicutes bacterium]|nr:DUF1028 domain-containing protein [Bacillota bacterium]